MHPLKVPVDAASSFFPIQASSRLVQLLKAKLPSLVTDKGILILLSAIQPSKARSPIEEAPESGIFTVARLSQKANAESPIVFTLAGIEMEVK